MHSGSTCHAAVSMFNARHWPRSETSLRSSAPCWQSRTPVSGLDRQALRSSTPQRSGTLAATAVLRPQQPGAMAAGAAGLLALLEEDDDALKLYALQQLDKSVHDFWFQISTSIAAIEALYEDEEFSHRELAALVASKVRRRFGRGGWKRPGRRAGWGWGLPAWRQASPGAGAHRAKAGVAAARERASRRAAAHPAGGQQPGQPAHSTTLSTAGALQPLGNHSLHPSQQVAAPERKPLFLVFHPALAPTHNCTRPAQVFYNLGDLDDALGYALGAGPLFDVNGRGEYVQTILGEWAGGQPGGLGIL